MINPQPGISNPPSLVSADRLYNLLPVTIRQRDVEQGEPLRALLAVIGEMVTAVQNDIDGLYNNLFVETCEPWVLPYIGALIGYEPTLSDSGDLRADLANTLKDRSRKGTLPLLEEVAEQVSQLSARALEQIDLLAVTEHLNYPRLEQTGTVGILPERGTINLRSGDALERLNTAFDDSTVRTVDLHGVNDRRGRAERGRYSRDGVSVFLWNFQAYGITHAPAYCDDTSEQRYTFDVLGGDQPLVVLPVQEPSRYLPATETNTPTPLRRRALKDNLHDYYGEGKSLMIWRGQSRTGVPTPVPADKIVVADLSQWRYQPTEDRILVDPERGRIVLGRRAGRARSLWVTYHYAFGADLGGGSYDRTLTSRITAAGERIIYRVRKAEDIPDGQKPSENEYTSIPDALAAWAKDRETPPATDDKATAPKIIYTDAIIQIEDNGVYTDPISVSLKAGERLEIRARCGVRPVLLLPDATPNGPDGLEIEGIGIDENVDETTLPEIRFDGLIIARRGTVLRGQWKSATFAHCTLVPGWMPVEDTAATVKAILEKDEDFPCSLRLEDCRATVILDHTISGTIRIVHTGTNGYAVASHRLREPITMRVCDSILDALDNQQAALSGPDCTLACADISFVRTTVLGEILAHSIPCAEDSIFAGIIRVARRQQGCMRYCFVPLGVVRRDGTDELSRTPPRYRCQPDLAITANQEADGIEADNVAAERVAPHFVSRRYGDPGYAYLTVRCSDALRQGAEDGGEMGAYHIANAARKEKAVTEATNRFVPALYTAGAFPQMVYTQSVHRFGRR